MKEDFFFGFKDFIYQSIFIVSCHETYVKLIKIFSIFHQQLERSNSIVSILHHEENEH